MTERQGDDLPQMQLSHFELRECQGCSQSHACRQACAIAMSLADDAVVLHIAGFLPVGLFRLQRLCAGVRRRLLSADVWLLAFRSGMKFASCDMGKTGAVRGSYDKTSQNEGKPQ